MTNLKLQNYNVVTATCGNEALELTIKEKPDIIILDAMLPDISGFELIHKIKLIDDIPIIMLTAKDDINDKLLGLQLGAEDYITKPFNSTELLLRIKVISKRINKFSKKTDKTLSLEGTTRAVDILIQRLRKKLGPCQTYIKTLYKAGYKFDL